MILTKNLACTIEHTLLKQDATEYDIEKLCTEAIEYDFFGICVNSCWIPLAAYLLEKTSVKIISTAGFPLGTCSTKSKCTETEQAINDGAEEVDFVMNVGWVKSGQHLKVLHEFQDLVKAAAKVPLKVILETCLLTDEEKRTACQLAVDAGVSFVKTSSGFNRSGATLDDVRLMVSQVGPHAKVKASGGIRTLENALEMLNAGAERLGTSSGISIINENEAIVKCKS